MPSIIPLCDSRRILIDPKMPGFLAGQPVNAFGNRSGQEPRISPVHLQVTAAGTRSCDHVGAGPQGTTVHHVAPACHAVVRAAVSPHGRGPRPAEKRAVAQDHRGGDPHRRNQCVSSRGPVGTVHGKAGGTCHSQSSSWTRRRFLRLTGRVSWERPEPRG